MFTWVTMNIRMVWILHRMIFINGANENKTTPKTAAPSIEDAVNAIKPYKEAGDDVIMFAISEDMSTTANVMRLAAKELYYEEHVFVINSESLSTRYWTFSS